MVGIVYEGGNVTSPFAWVSLYTVARSWGPRNETSKVGFQEWSIYRKIGNSEVKVSGLVKEMPADGLQVGRDEGGTVERTSSPSRLTARSRRTTNQLDEFIHDNFLLGNEQAIRAVSRIRSRRTHFRFSQPLAPTRNRKRPKFENRGKPGWKRTITSAGDVHGLEELITGKADLKGAWRRGRKPSPCLGNRFITDTELKRC